MFAIGFLSLLSLGFVAMASGGEAEDDAVAEPTVQNDDSAGDESEGQGDLALDLLQGDDPAPEDDAPAEEAEENEAPAAPESSEDSEDNFADSPPIDDDYADPLEEDEEQAYFEEEVFEEEEYEYDYPSAPEPAATPQDLVTVTGPNGQAIPDSQVLQTTEGAAEDGLPDHTVTAPEGANDIRVDYDADQSFLINYNEGTGTVTAGLNSVIEGPEGTIEMVKTKDVNEVGTPYQTLTYTQSFESSTDIEITVEADQIGAHSALVSLTNPEDTLFFSLPEGLEGNLHLVFTDTETEDDTDDLTHAVRRAYVVYTPGDVETLTGEDLAALLNDEIEGSAILAEVYLGEDSYSSPEDPDTNVSYTDVYKFLLNEDPDISASVEWTSVQNFDDSQLP